MLKEWLRLAIAWQRIKQVDLSKRLTEALGRSVDASAIYKMLRGERRMFADELLQIAKICKYPIPITSDGVCATEASLATLDALYRKTYDGERKRLADAPVLLKSNLSLSKSTLRQAIISELVASEATLTNKMINEAADRIIAACDRAEDLS